MFVSAHIKVLCVYLNVLRGCVFLHGYVLHFWWVKVLCVYVLCLPGYVNTPHMSPLCHVTERLLGALI